MHLFRSYSSQLWSVLVAERARFVPMAAAVLFVIPFMELWKANHWSAAVFWLGVVATLSLVVALRVAGPGSGRRQRAKPRGIVPRDAAK
jgi:hypothetical protein